MALARGDKVALYFDFSNKVVVVTGGSRGIGRAMVRAFADCGAKVVIASRKLENCVTLADEINVGGGQALPVRCHVGEWADCDALVEQAYAHFGTVDVLINNAGMSPVYPSLAEVSEALFDKVISVNLKGTFRLSALIGERMAKGDGGSIINVSSVASIKASPEAEPYGAAKAGVNALTHSFAYAFGPRVRVNCIVPGPFLTDISKAWDLDAFNERAAKTIPLKRGGQPEEVVGAALYLASDHASYTTASNIIIDGGSH